MRLFSSSCFQINPNPVSSGELFSAHTGSFTSKNNVSRLTADRLLLKDELGRTIVSYQVSIGEITMSLNPQSADGQAKLVVGTYFVSIM